MSKTGALRAIECHRLRRRQERERPQRQSPHFSDLVGKNPKVREIVIKIRLDLDGGWKKVKHGWYQ